MFRPRILALGLILLFTAGGAAANAADTPQPVVRDEVVQMAPVRIDGEVLFSVRGLAAHTARERAGAIAARIVAVANDRSIGTDSIVAIEGEQTTEIRAGSRLIQYIFDVDAELEGVTRVVLAQAYAAKIREAVEHYRHDRGSLKVATAAAYAVGATLCLAALHFLTGFLFRRLHALLEQRFSLKIRELQARSHDIVRTEGIWAALRGGLGVVRIFLVLLFVFLYVEVVLGLFPWTRAFAVPMLELLLVPLRNIGSEVLDYLPKFAFLVILVLLARYGLTGLKSFFLGIQLGRIRISGFEADWAIPVYKVARLAVIAFTVVVAYPYIPGSESPAFKGVSLFLGVVFSLGSSSTISNIVAGYMVIFRRAFKIGDRVRIGGNTGDVVEMRLQATHLRTIKNEEVVVPNSLIINAEVVNYSSLARNGGLILHTSVTIGYDTPWRQVHALLLLAADRTQGLLKDPKPFVLQTALDDFYVTYELNVSTDRPREMVQIYSDLHQNIQDAFNEFGVQIMSPHYLGDPAKAKVVPKEQWYQSPATPE